MKRIHRLLSVGYLLLQQELEIWHLTIVRPDPVPEPKPQPGPHENPKPTPL